MMGNSRELDWLGYCNRVFKCKYRGNIQVLVVLYVISPSPRYGRREDSDALILEECDFYTEENEAEDTPIGFEHVIILLQEWIFLNLESKGNELYLCELESFY